MSEELNAVFLSYASEDSDAAGRVAEALRAAGNAVWFDKSELRGGDRWDQLIRQRIRECRLFVPIISSNTESRPEGYFRREWKEAVERTRDMSERLAFIFPVVIDATPEAMADVPELFRSIQWTRLPGGEASAEFTSRVLALLGSKAALAPSSSTSASVDAGTESRWTRAGHVKRIFIALGTLVLLVGTVWLANTRLGTRSPSAPATSGDKSIAVLPFVDLSEKRNQEYFADGMAEEVLDLLVRVPGLRVIGRSSSFQFKGKNEDLRAIGEKLNTAYLVEGSVRSGGDRVRVTAELINAKTGEQVWSETYDRAIGDVLKLQDAIASTISRELQLNVADRSVSSRPFPKNAEAFDLVLRGNHAFDRADQDGFEEAATLYQRALAADPTYADAAAGLSWALESLGEMGMAPAYSFEQARRAAETALRLDPNHAEAHRALAQIHLAYDWDWDGAARELSKAAAETPSNASIPLDGEAILSFALGQWDDASRKIRAAIVQDPLNPADHMMLALIEARRRRFPEAIAELRRVIEIRPGYVPAHYELGTILLAAGNREGALIEMQQETNALARQQGLGMAYHALGRESDANAVLAGMIKEHATDAAWAIAANYAFRGESDEALRWLERARAQKDSNLMYLKGYLAFQVLQADPRMKAFLRKMKLPE